MSSQTLPSEQDASELEAAIDHAIAACGGDLRAAISALIVANHFLETEVEELKKAVSHALVRGRFQTYAG
jgi:regulator of replication initiation timing